METSKVDDAFTKLMDALAAAGAGVLEKAEQTVAAQEPQTKDAAPQDEGECCGCPDQEACEHEEADEAMANSIYDAEPGSAQLNVVLGILLAFAKRAGYHATATAAFDIWLDTEEYGCD